jgi:hypothetical protein
MKSFTSTATVAVIAAGVLAIAGSAHAEETYAGAALGARTHYGLDCNGSAVCDRNGNASGKVYLGRTYSPHFGAEVMAFSLGKASGSIDGANGRAAGRVRAEGVGAVAVARTQLDAVTFKARLGAAFEHGRTKYADGSSASKNALVPVLGVGASFALNKQWALTADWDLIGGRFNGKEKAGVQMLSVGAAFSF